MKIDNSQAVLFRKSPLDYQERYLHGLERKSASTEISPRDFGTRGHELFQEYYSDMQGKPISPYPESSNAALECEAQCLFALYLNQYPLERFDILDVERTFEVPLVGSKHILVGKMDVVINDPERDGYISIIDHKFEKRSSHKQSAKAWALRSQASMYFYAAEKIYNKPVNNLLLNLCKRASDKGQVQPEFPPRQTIQRTPEQIELAVRDMIYTADEIERCMELYGFDKPWPSYTENCLGIGDWTCDYYTLHIYGHTPEILTQYEIAKPYLDL